MFGAVVSDGLVHAHAPRQGHGAVRFWLYRSCDRGNLGLCESRWNKRGKTTPAVVHACRFMAFRSGCGLRLRSEVVVAYPIRHDDESTIQILSPMYTCIHEWMYTSAMQKHMLHASRLSLKPPELVSRQDVAITTLSTRKIRCHAHIHTVEKVTRDKQKIQGGWALSLMHHRHILHGGTLPSLSSTSDSTLQHPVQVPDSTTFTCYSFLPTVPFPSLSRCHHKKGWVRLAGPDSHSRTIPPVCP
jgi:hypothetical protein